jgi:hypothetical protein
MPTLHGDFPRYNMVSRLIRGSWSIRIRPKVLCRWNFLPIREHTIRQSQALGITRQNLHGQAWVFSSLLQVARLNLWTGAFVAPRPRRV